MSELTHINAEGEARMFDISEKDDTRREAVATGKITMQSATLEQIRSASLEKGDVLSVARVAAIMAAKKTPELIPLCHQIQVDDISLDFDIIGDDTIAITARVKSTGKTGAEMEALTAVSVAALTIYDMAKAVDRGMTVNEICLQSKKGGKNGTYRRK